ncbi:hypothetical protein [Cryptosporangium sp. NPDC048952]|uniref:hypothetical protein n=1 Tax=Cryptosporangium sp. NPDC048952 TaxID=3363961 RepID=UPI0037182296
MTYPQDPQGWQQPGGYDPNGGYGDPYAPQPTSGNPPQPTPLPPGHPGTPTPGYPGSPAPGYPGSPGYPGAPTSGYPGAPTSGYPGAPTSGYPGAPTSGYPGAPTSGYPQGAPTSGYPAAGYQAPGYGGYPPVPPPKKSRTGLILGIVAGVVVLMVIVGSIGAWALFSGDDPDPIASSSPSAPPSPTASPSPTDPAQLAQFKDPDLREFARRAAGEADRCEVITSTIPAGNNAAEALKCIYGANYQVYFLRYKTLADRDSYAQSARTGFSDDSLVVDGDTFWTDDQQVRQGNFITGHNTSDSGRYVFWDVPGKPVSGEVYTTGTDAAATEKFWRTIR